MLDCSKIKEEIVYIFPFGSVVYGTNSERSDEDYIVVVKGNENLEYGIHEENKNIFVYSERTFLEMIKNHDISAMECIFSNETIYKFHLDLETLRRSISGVIYNSFVKCGKKLTPGEEYNPYIAKKSLFHSLRIANFAIQIAKYGKIIDFTSSNHYYDEIMSAQTNDWNYFKEKYGPILFELKEEFKKLAPLEKDKRKTKKIT